MTTQTKESEFTLLKIPQDLIERGRGIAGMGHDVWLAGLGAFAAVEEEGSSMFNNLVERGRTVEVHELAGAELDPATRLEQETGLLYVMEGERVLLEEPFDPRSPAGRALGHLGELGRRHLEQHLVVDLQQHQHALDLGRPAAWSKRWAARSRESSRACACPAKAMWWARSRAPCAPGASISIPTPRAWA